MEQSGFIVGIDLGTSKIAGVLARKNEQGIISILASESVPSDSCVKYGVIYNIDEAAGKVKKLISLLENKTGKKIGKAYVSVSGRSLRIIDHVETKLLDNSTPITLSVLEDLENKAKNYSPEFFTNYRVLTSAYYLDGKLEEEPIDKTASSIEGRYRLIIGRPNIKASLQKSIAEKAKIEIVNLIPATVGALVLEDEDIQKGCALIDFGAGTTSLYIYKDGLLSHMSVIPFGGRTITKDMKALGFDNEQAENYKVKYGKIGKDKSRPSGEAAPKVDLRELNKVIQLRQDEIALNVINQIKESGYGENLDAGIIIMGGASQMNGMVDYLAEKAQMPVKQAGVKRIFINNAAELLQNPHYTEVLSLLLYANKNCEKEEVVQATTTPETTVQMQEPIKAEPAPKEVVKEKEKLKKGKKGGFWNKLQGFGGTLFDGEE